MQILKRKDTTFHWIFDLFVKNFFFSIKKKFKFFYFIDYQIFVCFNLYIKNKN